MGNVFCKPTSTSDCFSSGSKKRRPIPRKSPLPAVPPAAAAAINTRRMDEPPLFWGGSDLANLLVLSEFLQHSWDCVSEVSSPRDRDVDDRPGVSVKFGESGRGKYRVICFDVSCAEADYLRQEGDLVSSALVPEFEFLCSKVKPCFSLNKGAVNLFRSVAGELARLRMEVVDPTKTVPCVITGSGLGGWVASLFTLWLLEKLNLATMKRPLCITFGAPLLGDIGFQLAISQYSTWNSCFLHIVHKDDAFPKAYISSAVQPASQVGSYMPFGTYMWCSESGCACYEAPESIMELLVMSTGPDLNEGIRSYNYGAMLANLKVRSICMDPFNVCGEDVEFRAGISAGITATGLVNSGSRGGQRDIDAALKKIATAEADVIKRHRSVFDPAKRLNEVKVFMAYMEWYKKVSEAHGGYYDCYKNKAAKRDHEVVRFKIILTEYWEQVVEEVEKKPQREGAPMRARWLFGGTNYRRLVEPLEIAEYYLNGKNQYLTRGRPSHYKQLEQWLKINKSGKQHNGPHRVRKQDISAVVTEDSCFWAHVEEAIIACKSLKHGGGSNGGETETIKVFEGYVMVLTKDYALSPDIFLEGSSFMQWWKDYDVMLKEQRMGVGYTSPLIEFMSSRRYEDYVNGTFGSSDSITPLPLII